MTVNWFGGAIDECYQAHVKVGELYGGSIDFYGTHIESNVKASITGTDTNKYTCILDHISTADDRPTTGANWATYWVLGSSLITGGTWGAGTQYRIPYQMVKVGAVDSANRVGFHDSLILYAYGDVIDNVGFDLDHTDSLIIDGKSSGGPGYLFKATTDTHYVHIGSGVGWGGNFGGGITASATTADLLKVIGPTTTISNNAGAAINNRFFSHADVLQTPTWGATFIPNWKNGGVVRLLATDDTTITGPNSGDSYTGWTPGSYLTFIIVNSKTPAGAITITWWAGATRYDTIFPSNVQTIPASDTVIVRFIYDGTSWVQIGDPYPSFVGVNLSGLTASLPVVTDASKNLASLAYTGATSFRKNLGLETSDSPTFSGGLISAAPTASFQVTETTKSSKAFLQAGLNASDGGIAGTRLILQDNGTNGVDFRLTSGGVLAGKLSLQNATAVTNLMTWEGTGNIGVNTNFPARRVDILDATNPQLRLTQADGTKYVEFQANSSGNLVLTPSAGALTGYLYATAGVVSATGGIGVTCTGVSGTDDEIIQAAITALPTEGGEVNIGPGTCSLNATVTMGTGTTSAVSTRKSIALIGSGGGGTDWNPSLGNFAGGGTKFQWVGAAGGIMVRVDGPIAGVRVENIHFDANTGNLGVEIATGTLTSGHLYYITATEVNHFYTACVVGGYFYSLGTETCDANNKVKEVLSAATALKVIHASQSTFKNLSAIGHTGAAFDLEARVQPILAANTLVNGTSYRIQVVGDTDWTAIGAASNTQFLTFTKSGAAGSGTGTASFNLLTFSGMSDNTWTNIFNDSALPSAVGIKIGQSTYVPYDHDVNRNTFTNCWFMGGGATGTAIELRFVDASTFVNVSAGGYHADTKIISVIPPTDATSYVFGKYFPQSLTFINCPLLSNNQWQVTGTWTPLDKIIVWPNPTGDGESNPVNTNFLGVDYKGNFFGPWNFRGKTVSVYGQGFIQGEYDAYSATNGAWVRDHATGVGLFTPTSGDPSASITVGDDVYIYADGATMSGFYGNVSAVDATTIHVDQTFGGVGIPPTAANGMTCKFIKGKSLIKLEYTPAGVANWITIGGDNYWMSVTPSANLKLNSTNIRATTEGTGHIDVFNGTAPVGTLENGISFYSADFSAGNAIPYFMTENGTAIGLNQSLLTTNSPTFAALTVTAGLGVNGKTPQTAYSVTAWDEPGAGAFGVDSAAHMAALVQLVQDIQAALIANGILSTP
jgi:hypothetical protein